MNIEKENLNIEWPLWRKVIFRFFFIYLLFRLAPWEWLDKVPGLSFATQYFDKAMEWAVKISNTNIFHVKKILVMPNGSGDTSYAWAELWLLLCVAALGCVIWSLIDRKRPNYIKLNYWLCLFSRYFLVYVAFTYGILKIFGLQMPFPNLHQLATPLGDLLPMRLSWMFIGYSTPYQFFSGSMEVLAALLLLNRRTATLGILVAAGVFVNVMMLNLCYDIPVKIFSMQLVFICFFLLANEGKRLFYFLILNKPAPIGSIYDFTYTKKHMRVARYVFKAGFIIIATILPFIDALGDYNSDHKPQIAQKIKNGVYRVIDFRVNNRSSKLLIDSLQWQDVIFEDGLGSIKTTDTIFRQRYRRGYFSYSSDSANNLHFRKYASDSLAFTDFHFEIGDSTKLFLKGKLHGDSVFVELKRTNRHFQLTEKQFHWLSEQNR